jgi:hypothetical protein
MRSQIVKAHEFCMLTNDRSAGLLVGGNFPKRDGQLNER